MHLGHEELEGFGSALKKWKAFPLSRNAISQCKWEDVLLDWEHYRLLDHTYSHVVSHEFSKVTAQKNSGRCWIFAALNLLRIHLGRKYLLEEFEFSQSYLFFYDKLEKSNYFLNNIVATAREPEDSRLFMYLLDKPVQDGGQWDMFVNLVEKYGLLPQTAMPDTQSNKESKMLNYILTKKLRSFAVEIRTDLAANLALELILARKREMMQEIYQILCVHFGEPPKEFDWEFRDKKGKYHRYPKLNPFRFYREWVKEDLTDYLCLVHSPRPKTPYNQSYTIDYLGNVVEGKPILYLNVEMSDFKEAALKALKHDEPVWFGADVRHDFHRPLGLMDHNLFETELFYNTSFPMSKEQRMRFGESAMNHAMLFTGVEISDHHSPTRWRVENSWGDSIGKKGYCLMTDSWFNEYMFEIAVPKKYLSKELLAIAAKPPIPLPPWDPLGALA